MGAMTLFIWGMVSIQMVSSLTCYNGMKLMRGQSMGQQTEECGAGASCYNMTSSAAFVVDVVKAGCSTWRCMMAKDRCIGININFVPVSLCCCSHDRCNVGGNPHSGGMGGGSNYGGGGGSGYGQSGNGGETAGGWGAPGYPAVKAGGEQGGSPYGGGGAAGYGGYGSGGYGGGGYGGDQGNNNGGSQMGGSAYGGGGYGGFGGDNAGKVNIGMSNAAKPQSNNKKPSLTKEQIETAFKNFDVDNKQHGTGGGGGDVEEESFSMVDVTKTTPRPSGRGPAPPTGGKINL